MNRARIRKFAAIGPILLVLVVAIGCVPNPPRYNTGGAAHKVTVPVFRHTLGVGRNNDPAVVRYLQDKLNVLSSKWKRTARALAGRNGSGKFDQQTVNAVIWARGALNAHLAAEPVRSNQQPHPRRVRL